MSKNALQGHESYTYKDYLTWPDGQRWEIIHGKAYQLASPDEKHQQIAAQLTAEFVIYLRGRQCRAFPAPFDVLLPSKTETEMTATNVVQPDLLVVCDKSKLDGKKCIGAPDLVIEIISRSTAKNDLHDKYILYEQHGVREYWLIHPDYPVIQQFINTAEGVFKKVQDYFSGDTIQPHIFPDLEIQLSNIFGPAE